MHCVRNALEGPGQPPHYMALKRSRDYAAPRHDLGSRRATHLRAQLKPEMSVAAGIVLVVAVEVA